MGYALHVWANNQAAIGNNSAGAIFADRATAGSESACATPTRAGTLSKLGRRNLGGSGTNSVITRINAGNGTLVASAAGAGWVEDTTHSDPVADGDLVNLLFSDDGTNPNYGNAKVLFKASGDHAAAYGIASSGVIYDIPSATRYIGFFGAPVADGTATEVDAQIKNRGSKTLRSFTVRCTSNARTNQSDLGVNINGSPGNSSAGFAAGATGTIIDTDTDALADGDLFCGFITLLTGTEDLTLSYVGCWLTNAVASKNELVLGCTGSRTASATPNYMPIGGFHSIATETTEGDVNLQPGFDGRLSNLTAHVTANTYTGSCTVKIFKNGSAVLTLTISAGTTGIVENTSDTVDFAPTDTLSYEIVGGTANSISLSKIIVTIEDLTPPLTSGVRTHGYVFG